MNNTVSCVNLWGDTSWFAIQTKTRQEKFAATNIATLGIRILLPLVRVERLMRGNPRGGTKPLFPGYFFARFCPQNSLESVKVARGVLQVVGSGRMAIPIPDGVVQEIQGRAKEDGFIHISPRVLTPGTLVTIQDGPFQGMMGRVEREFDDRKRVAIFLETLFRARVLVERRLIEAEAA